MTTIIALEYKTEKVFRTFSVASNLVTSLEFNPIRCATMLSHFGQTRKSSIATHFNLLNSTALSSATGGYVVIPERFGRNEETAGSKEERT